MANEDLDLDPEGDQSDEAGETSPDSIDLDAELRKLGFTPLPEDATVEDAKKALIERIKTYQSGITPKLQRGSQLEMEVARLQGQLEILQAQQVKSTAPAKEGPPEGLSDEQILEWYIDRALEKKVMPQLNHLSTFFGQEKLDRLRTTKPGWLELEPQILAAMRAHPTLTADEAYKLANEATLEARAEKLAEEKLRRKKAIGNPLSSSGAVSEKAMDLSGIRALPEAEARRLAFEAAKKAVAPK